MADLASSPVVLRWQHPVADTGDLILIAPGSIYQRELQITAITYGQIAASYVKEVSLPDIIKQERQRIQQGINFIAKEFPALSVLDIGCAGARDLGSWVSSKVNYFGVDYSPEMIQIARNNAGIFGIPDSAFVVANLIDMQVHPSSVEIVWCSSVIQHVPKDLLGKALRNFHEALKPNGLLYLNVRPPKDGVPVEGIIISHEYQRRDGEQIVDRFIAHYSVADLEKALKEIGFEVVDQESYAEAYAQHNDHGEKAAYLPEKYVIFAKKVAL